jgi:hypothetical protein
VAGKAAEFVHVEAYDTTVRRRMRSECYTDVVAGGALLVSAAALRELGGWALLPQAVDRDLLDRTLAAGGRVYRTHGFGYVYHRHADGHTWAVDPAYFVQNPAGQWPGLPPYEEFGPAR